MLNLTVTVHTKIAHRYLVTQTLIHLLGKDLCHGDTHVGGKGVSDDGYNLGCVGCFDVGSMFAISKTFGINRDFCSIVCIDDRGLTSWYESPSQFLVKTKYAIGSILQIDRSA